MDIFAIVGAYPEPFVHGTGGKRIPTRLACSDPEGPACQAAGDALEDAGVVVTRAALDAPAGEGTLRVLVGPWPELRGLRVSAPLEEGSEASGVFARFVDGGQALELLDRAGETAETQDGGAGLVAALAPPGEGTTWFVTGVDDAGALAAAKALDPKDLRDRFAVAVTPADGVVALPAEGAGGD
jgi:hypothetical protein